MTPSKSILAGSLIIAAAIVASAALFLPRTADTTADSAAPRYQIVKVEKDRTWRLDSRTGRITLCRLEGDNLVCAESTEATRFPQKSPGDIASAREAERLRQDAERRRQEEAEERRHKDKVAERNYIFDRFFALFERVLRFAEKHPDRIQPSPETPDET